MSSLTTDSASADPITPLIEQFATIHVAIGDTPRHHNPAPTPANEMSRTVDNNLFAQLDESTWEVKTNSFIEKLLYRLDDGSLQRDRDVAKKCLNAMKATDSKEWKDVRDTLVKRKLHGADSFPPKDLSGVAYVCNRKRGHFEGLEAVRSKPDKAFYKPTVALLSFIQEFHRNEKVDGQNIHGDENWPAAKNPIPLAKPRPPTTVMTPSATVTASNRKSTRTDRKPAIIVAQPDPNRHLQRAFVNTSRHKPHFSDKGIAQPDHLPDLSLVLLDPVAKGEDRRSYWRDIKVAIEAKPDKTSLTGVNPTCQAARYARCMKMEQFDRNFYFTISISPDGCRIWHWDTVACHVSEFIDFATQPETFIQLIGCIATMNPQSLGYDDHFSNAGRVLGAQNIPTTLKIIPSTVQQPDSPAPAMPIEGEQPRVYVLDPTILYQARDTLFNRSTTVWSAYLESEGVKSARHVITQKWQDDTRVSEAWFCDQANNIKDGVAHMAYSEQSDSTREYHAGLEMTRVWNSRTMVPTSDPCHSSLSKSGDSGAVISGSDRKESKSFRRNFFTTPVEKSGKPTYERYLLRLVFTDMGRQLRFATGPKQMLGATLDAVRGLLQLWELGITHRDISPGNFLLNTLANASTGMRGFVVDLGLAAFTRHEDVNDLLPAGVTAAVHHHLTGTLPYMALELLENPNCSHDIRHDLESVFWLLLCVCLHTTMEHVAELATLQPEGGLTTKIMGKHLGLMLLQQLKGTDIFSVTTAKTTLLTKPDLYIKITGRHADLQDFLIRFALHCNRSYICPVEGQEPTHLNFGDVIKLIEDTLATLPDDPTPPADDSKNGGASNIESKRRRSSSLSTCSEDSDNLKRFKTDRVSAEE
ncbi:hypothetical protein FRB97_003535 [Tulasnella sp. 331]|nr:hypothetical protein FRB97_003535 [Tulasnella sp. 331]